MRNRKDGWHSAQARTMVYFDGGAPIAVATLLNHLESAQAAASKLVGEDLILDTWFYMGDSPHAGLASNASGVPWDGNWMLAGVGEYNEDRSQ